VGPDLGATFAILPSALLMLAVQMWVAVRSRSFTVPIGVGIGSTTVTIMLLRRLKNAASTSCGPVLASVFPWSLPYVTISPEATAGLRDTAFLVVSSGACSYRPSAVGMPSGAMWGEDPKKPQAP
jgi:hypothetical protein